MQSNMNVGPSFQGWISISTFTDAGKETVKHFKTRPSEDALIKRVSNSISPNGMLARHINTSAASDFAKLIELITLKRLPETTQQKLMTNGYTRYVDYGDLKPENGGAFVHVDFKA